MNANLRSPTVDDIPQLVALGRDTFVETFGKLYSDQDLQTFLKQVYTEEAFAQELRDPGLTFRVINDGRQLIAFVKIGRLHVPVENPSPAALELRQMYVRRAWIGQGLGRRMIDWANAEFTARGADEVYVSVFSENERAIAFYERDGFKKCGEYGFRVGAQIDREWIMSKRMKLSLHSAK